MTQKAKKIINIVLSATWWAFLIALIAFISTVMIAKSKGEVPMVFGYSVMKITTPSMEDEIPSGSYILIKKCQPQDVKKDDIICFYSLDPTIYGYPNTHRVVSEPEFDGEKYVFVTKGDNNPVPDSVPANSDMLIGKYVRTLGGVASLEKATQSPMMIVVLISVQLIIVAIIVTMTVIKKRNNIQGQVEDENQD